MQEEKIKEKGKKKHGKAFNMALGFCKRIVGAFSGSSKSLAKSQEVAMTQNEMSKSNELENKLQGNLVEIEKDDDPDTKLNNRANRLIQSQYAREVESLHGNSSTKSWIDATEFFKDIEPSSSKISKLQQEGIFKIPVQIKKLHIKGDSLKLDIKKIKAI